MEMGVESLAWGAYTKLNEADVRGRTLAALVTEETAELLERLAYAIGNIGTNEDAEDAFELAASIREALEADND